jgi:phenylacetaldehyde dehydrogenase
VSSPQHAAAAFLPRDHRLLIDGEWVPPLAGGAIQVFDPATEEQIATVAGSQSPDVDLAVAAARRAFERGPWRAMSGAARGRLIWRLSDLLLKNAHELAELETFDNGRPMHDIRAGDLPVASDLLRYFAG